MWTPWNKNLNAEYYRTEHWINTSKMFRRKHGGEGCYICHMSADDHWEVYATSIHVHHRNYNFKGCERWCDLELLCEPHHTEVTKGHTILPMTPTDPSTEFIHPCDPAVGFPPDFGWWTKTDRDAHVARELNLAESRPLQTAREIKEQYPDKPAFVSAKQFMAPPAPAPEIVPPLVQAEQNARDKQEQTFRAFDKAVTEVLDEYTRKFWNPLRNAFTALRNGEIAPEHMRKLVAHYIHHIHAEMNQLVTRQDEMVIAVPQFVRVGLGKLQAKFSRTFPAEKTNGHAEP